MVRMLFGFGSQTPPHSIGSAPFSKCLPLPILHPGFWQGRGMSTREEGESAICAVYAQRCGDSGKFKFLSWPCLEGVVLFNEA